MPLLLTESELLEVNSVNPNNKYYESNDRPPIQLLLASCANYLRISI